MRTRVPAIALTALLLLAAAAGVVGGFGQPDAGGSGGTAAAGVTDASVAREVQADTGDASLQSGDSYWQGWRLSVDTSQLSAGGPVELWRVSDAGELSRRVRTLQGSNGTVLLETGDLEGRYTLRVGEQVVYVDDGSAYLENPPDGASVTVGESAFRIERQTLSFDLSDPTVYPGQRTFLAVSSNRDDYVVAVSADTVSFENLSAAFPRSAFAADHDARADQDVLLLRLDGRSRLAVNTTTFPAGTDGLFVGVTDTTAFGSVGLSVQTPAENRQFTDVERNEHVGDVVETQLRCDDCFVVVGGPGEGMLDILEVHDSNGDGSVTLLLNTRYMGMAAGASGFPSGVRAYTSPEDRVRRYSSSADLVAVQESLVTTLASLNDMRKEFGMAPAGRDRPVSPGSITLTVTSSDYLLPRGDYGDRPPLGSKLVIRDETDVETVLLHQRFLEGVQPMTAPGAVLNDPDPTSVARSTTPRDAVAVGDSLVLRLDVSGVYGYLAAEGESLASLRANAAEGIDLKLVRLPDGEDQSVTPVRLERTRTAFLAAHERDHVYVFVRTGPVAGNQLTEGRYRATITLSGVDKRYDAYSINGAHRGYPYLPPGASERETATVHVAEPSGNIATPPNATARQTADGELIVQGETNLAPGGDVRVLARSTQYDWETGATVPVTRPGNWTVALDLSNAPGERFRVTLARGQSQLDEELLTVLPPASGTNSSDGNASDGGGDGGAGGSGSTGSDGTDAGDSSGLLPDLSGLAGLAVPVGGGVGVVVVAWAAWRLVIRRILL